MRTVVAYSFKGGLGRTLLAANLGHAFARLGMRVVLLDLDVEAPGLHHKVLPDGAHPSVSTRGLVGLVGDYVAGGGPPTTEDVERELVPVETAGAGQLRILPAGPFPYDDVDYFRSLAAFPGEPFVAGRAGSAFFLELKDALEATTDVLIVDARTGITELGGLATTLLGDVVVGLTSLHDESLNGLRAVARAIAAMPATEFVPVLARVSDDHPTFPADLAPSEADAWHAALVIREDADLRGAERLPLAHIAPGSPVDDLLLDYLRVVGRLTQFSMDEIMLPVIAALNEGHLKPVRRARLLELAAIRPTRPVLLALLREATHSTGAVTLGVAALAAVASRLGADDDVRDILQAVEDGAASDTADGGLLRALEALELVKLDERGGPSDDLVRSLVALAAELTPAAAADVGMALLAWSPAGAQAIADARPNDPELLILAGEVALESGGQDLLLARRLVAANEPAGLTLLVRAAVAGQDAQLAREALDAGRDWDTYTELELLVAAGEPERAAIVLASGLGKLWGDPVGARRLAELSRELDPGLADAVLNALGFTPAPLAASPEN